jgi:hypothetical protein
MNKSIIYINIFYFTLKNNHVKIKISYGVMELWSYGVMELWSYGVMELWSYGVMELWNRKERNKMYKL